MMTYELIEEGLKVIEGDSYIIYDYITKKRKNTNIDKIDNETNNKFIKFAIDKFNRLINRYVDNINFTVNEFDDILVNSENLKGIKILEDTNHIQIKQERYIVRQVLVMLKNQCIIKPRFMNTTVVTIECRLGTDVTLVNIDLTNGLINKCTIGETIEKRLAITFAHFIYDNRKRFIESITKKHNSLFIKDYELFYNNKTGILSYIVQNEKKTYYEGDDLFLSDILPNDIIHESLFVLDLKANIKYEIKRQIQEMKISIKNSTLYYDIEKKLELNKELYDASQMSFFNETFKETSRKRFKTILDGVEEVNNINFMKEFLSKIKMNKSVYTKAYDGSTELEINNDILLINPDNNKININDRIVVDDYDVLKDKQFDLINAFNDVRVYIILFRDDLIYNPNIKEMIKRKNIEKFLKCYPKHYLTKDDYSLKKFFNSHASYEHHKMIFLAYLHYIKDEFDIEKFNNNQCRIRENDLIYKTDYNEFDKVNILNINAQCIVKQICRINNMMHRKFSFEYFLKEIYKYNLKERSILD